MKKSKLYISALLFAAVAFVGCDDNWDTPPLDGPVATMQANSTIAELKAAYWFAGNNGVDTVRTKENGDHYIIKGRVVSSDEAGNIYKNLVIQDTYDTSDTPACITFSINANSLYASYRPGQEIVVDATNMYLGKYAGLQQFGYPDFSSTYGWQTTFMSLEFFKEHIELNGLPEPEKIDTLVTTIASLPADDSGVQRYQSQLVRFDNVKFEDGGKSTYAEYQTTKSHNITDGTASLAVRTSGYANFYYQTLPTGTCSVIGILGYFNGSWQLTLRDINDVIVGAEVKGSKNNPYSVSEAIAAKGGASDVWTKGYIVGAVAPGVSSVSKAADIEWGGKATLSNTLVIAESAAERDYTKCIVIDLPQGSSLRTKANLADTPDNIGAEITLKGKIGTEYGMTAITGNTGTDEEFIFVSQAALSSLSENFDSYASQASSSGYVDFGDANLGGQGWSLVTTSGNKNWSMRNYSDNVYATFSGYKGTAPFDSWLITPLIDIDKLAEKVMSFRTQVNGYSSTTSKFQVYLMTSNDPSASTNTEISCRIATAPASGYSEWVSTGDIDLSGYTGKYYIGFRYTATSDSNYATWCFDDLLVGTKSGTVVTNNDGSETKPYSVADVLGGTTGSDVWVNGYIVGYSSGTDALTSAKFTAEGANALNVLLAASATETNPANCIAVGLPSGDIRTAVNLKDNASNLGKQISVKGTITTVYKIPGVNSLTAYKF